jgi:hypothetical protein
MSSCSMEIHFKPGEHSVALDFLKDEFHVRYDGER